MQVLIAPDSFKDSLTASQVAKAMAIGVKQFSNNSHCHFLAASDGGEGFLEAVKRSESNLQVQTTNSVDPLGNNIKASYLLNPSTQTAYIELAQASGIELVPEDKRNPLKTSTYGTGLQIKHAIELGSKRVIIGLGGSATNDAGIGIATALGYSFLDSNQEELKPIGENLSKIDSIIKPTETYEDVEFFAVNDVSNSLFGLTGAAYTYAKQKGASEKEIEYLDTGLKHLHHKMIYYFSIDEANTPGAGAAGGTAYGLKCFLQAEFKKGTSFVLDISNFSERIIKDKISLIITGEGKIDDQTSYGKFAYGILQEANKYNVPVLAVCGRLLLNTQQWNELGFLDVREIYQPDKPISYSFENAERLVSEVTTQMITAHFK